MSEEIAVDEVRTLFVGEEVEVATASTKEEDEVFEKELKGDRRRKVCRNKKGCKKTS